MMTQSAKHVSIL